MKSRTLIIALTGALLLSLGSCKTYPDGPSLSILSKKSRLANEWVIHKIYTNDIDVTAIWVATYPDFLWTIKKDYVYEMLTNGITTTGTWELVSDKEQLKITEDGSPTPDVYDIYRLKNDELWLYRVVGGDETEMHFIPKED